MFSNFSYYQTNSYELSNSVLIIGVYLGKKEFEEFSRIIDIIKLFVYDEFIKSFSLPCILHQNLKKIFAKIRIVVIMIIYFTFSRKS